MNDTVTVDIPYESLDPLTIGSCDDPGSVYREQLLLDVPRRNLWAWLKPNEPPALPDVTAAAAAALERPVGGPRFSELIGPDTSLAIIIDNQFRPTPASKLLPAVFDAVERRGVRDTKGAVCHLNFGAHPQAHREAVRVFNDVYAYRRPLGGPADIAICGVFAPTDHLFFHTGWGCMSADLVLKDGGDGRVESGTGETQR